MSVELDINEIMALLPHRYPFVLVDRILELDPGDRIVAVKNVTINEPYFQGHFPGNPVMPGVLIIEAMGQAGGVLVYYSLPESQRRNPLYFAAMDRARFRRTVIPGDQLVSRVRMVHKRSRAFKMVAESHVEGNLVAQAELMATFGGEE